MSTQIDLDKKKVRSELLTRVVVVIGVAAVIATVVIQAFVLARLNNEIDTAVSQAQANGELSKQVIGIAKKVESVARRTRSCSTPGDKCYEEQQANITDLVENINKITLLTAVCVDEIAPKVSALEVRACVVKKIAHESTEGSK